MPSRKMTFTLPEEVAASFLRKVGPSRRSKYVAEAIEAKLREREEMLKAACLAANEDPETREIQAEFDALPDTMTEEWDDTPSR
jgi:metal-responsive CopG/Arc/MetJ family transcriptional regulator